MSIKCFWDIDSQSFLPVLHSASKQHISGGREHSSPIQSIPSPKLHSRLHCKRRETSPIGKSLLKIHHDARPLGTCLFSTQIPVVYRGNETVLHVADGLFCCCSFIDISTQTTWSYTFLTFQYKCSFNRISKIALQQHNHCCQCFPQTCSGIC